MKIKFWHQINSHVIFHEESLMDFKKQDRVIKFSCAVISLLKIWTPVTATIVFVLFFWVQFAPYKIMEWSMWLIGKK